MPSLWNVDDSTAIIYKLDQSGNVLNSFLGPAPSGYANGLAYDRNQAQNTLVHTVDTDSIYEIDETGSANLIFNAPPDDGAGVDSDSCLWLSDNFNDFIAKYDRTGSELTSFASPGAPGDNALDNSGCIWNVDTASDSITRYNQAGSTTSQIPTPSSAPFGLGIESSESLWHADAVADSIYKLDWNGTIQTTFISPSDSPEGLTTEDEPLGAGAVSLGAVLKTATSGVIQADSAGVVQTQQ